MNEKYILTDKTRKENFWVKEYIDSKGSLTLFDIIILYIILITAFLIKPIANLRIGLLHNRAMGKFYGHTEYYLRLRKYKTSKKKDIAILISGDPVNKQILKMVSREVTVIKNAWLHKKLNKIKKNNNSKLLWIDLSKTGWLRGDEWRVPGPQLKLLKDEQSIGYDFLKTLGITKDDKFVCMFAKDRFYTDSPDTTLDPNSYWGSNDFRNCDITKYINAAKYLTDKGIFVFRMGIHKPEFELNEKDINSKIIDYTSKVRPYLNNPDLIDTFLHSNCKFFLGTTSGIYILSSMFNVPVAYTNMIPYGECGRADHDIFILKKCRSKLTKKFLTFQELIDIGMDSDWLTEEEIKKYEQDGIEFVENTEEEIYDLVVEMNERIDGNWASEKEDDLLMNKFRVISPAICFDGSPFPGKVGANFLRKNKLLLSRTK